MNNQIIFFALGVPFFKAEIEQCSKPFEPELGHSSGGK